MNTTTTAPTERDQSSLPSVGSVALRRIGYELRTYRRSADTMVFTFLFPLIMISIFSVAFGDDTVEVGEASVDFATLYLPAMLASGVFLSGMQLMAADIATDRLDGTLKRYRATPLTAISYFIGKSGQVVITGLIQQLAILAYAHLVFGVALPDSTGKWGIYAGVFIGGLLVFAMVGVGVSAVPSKLRSVTAVITPVVVLLQFISGVFLPFFNLPSWLQQIAALFPLKWVGQGMRAAFLPDQFKVLEAAGQWELGRVVLVLGVWLVIGSILARLTFRWNRREG